MFEGDEILTNGGRVLSAVAVRNDLKTAIEAAYSTIKHVTFDGMFYRNDIETACHVSIQLFF